MKLKFLNLNFLAIIPFIASLQAADLDAFDALGTKLETSHCIKIFSGVGNKLRLRADNLGRGDMFVKNQEQAEAGRALEAIKEKGNCIDTFYFQHYEHCDFLIPFLKSVMPACSNLKDLHMLKARYGDSPSVGSVSAVLHHFPSFHSLKCALLEPAICDEILSFQMIAAVSRLPNKDADIGVNTSFGGKGFFIFNTFLNDRSCPSGFKKFFIDGGGKCASPTHSIERIRPSLLTLENSDYNADTLAGLLFYLEQRKGTYISGLTVHFPLGQDDIDTIKSYCPDIDVTVVPSL